MQKINDVNFADLNEHQVNQLKQFEDSLNYHHGNKNEELIVLAFAKAK